MKITFLTPHINISGGVKLILGYADRLHQRGHKVTVVCPQSFFCKRTIMNFLKYKPDWIKVAADINYVRSYDEKYIPDADVIVATAWQTAPYVSRYNLSKGKKFYLFLHYERLKGTAFSSDVDNFTYKLPLKKIVISSHLQQVLKKRFNQTSQILTTPIDHQLFYPVRKKYNSSKRICMLYHTVNWKGISDGIQAFKIAQQKYPAIRLVMFGARKQDVDIDCEYHYRPLADQLRQIYNSCDIFLCPSWVEGFGLPSAEAMACKCALVTTDNGGSRDYAFHQQTALVSPPRQPKLLAANLIKLLDDKNLLKKIAQNGYEHIKHFSWSKSVNQLEKIFMA